MQAANNILLVRVASLEGVDYREMRDDILESVRLGVLILGMDDTCEVMELPPLGDVEVEATEKQEAFVTNSGPPSLIQADATVKRAILQRLSDYRKENGLGCLEKIAEKTAHFMADRLSAETLRMIITGDAPKMDIAEWEKIGKALDALEVKSNDSDRA